MSRFGTEIANNPVGSATIRQLQNLGDNVVVNLDMVNAPRGLMGRWTTAFNEPNTLSIFARNHSSAQASASTFVHEARHAISSARGRNQLTQSAEYMARAREYLFTNGIRPDAAARRQIRGTVERLYPELPWR